MIYSPISSFEGEDENGHENAEKHFEKEEDSPSESESERHFIFPSPSSMSEGSRLEWFAGADDPKLSPPPSPIRPRPFHTFKNIKKIKKMNRKNAHNKLSLRGGIDHDASISYEEKTVSPDGSHSILDYTFEGNNKEKLTDYISKRNHNLIEKYKERLKKQEFSRRSNSWY